MQAMEGKPLVGTVKWFSAKKGYGFLIDEHTGADVFVHYSAISMEGFKTLEPGARVTFHKIFSEKGLRAVNVTPLPNPEKVCRSL